MRHLFGIALAGVMAAAMFFGGAWGYLRLLKLPAPPHDPGVLPAGGGSLLADGPVLLALAALVVTGVLAGALMTIPGVSPLAAGLPGLLLLGWTALYLLSVRRATEIIPLRASAFGAGWEALLYNGVLGAAGLAMIVPMALPSRWHGKRSAARDSEAGAAADSAGEAPVRDLWEPVHSGRRTGGGTPPAAETDPFTAPRTGPAQPADPAHTTGPIGGVRVTAPTRPATGPIAPGTGPIRTTSPIKTGPIRLRAPEEHSGDWNARW